MDSFINILILILIYFIDSMSMMYPDMYNYNLASLSHQSESEMSTVTSVTGAVTSLASRLGWDSVILIMVNTGLTQMVTNTLVADSRQETCCYFKINKLINTIDRKQLTRAKLLNPPKNILRR